MTPRDSETAPAKMALDRAEQILTRVAARGAAAEHVVQRIAAARVPIVAQHVVVAAARTPPVAAEDLSEHVAQAVAATAH